MSTPTRPQYSPGVEPHARAVAGPAGLPAGRCLAFAQGNLLVAEANGEVQFPDWDDLRQHDMLTLRRQFLGDLDGEPLWSVELAPDVTPPAGLSLLGLRDLYGRVPDEVFAVAGRAAQIVAWDRDHQHCGRCGSHTVPVPGERARRCPECGLMSYPRLTPAIIVLIERGDEILLARGHQFVAGRFGIVAGFVEPGESLEEAVIREIHEEVGLEVADITYFGSQPWPFPHGIMIGFRAQHAGGEISLDDGELAEAGWYSTGNLPNVPPKLSIARRLIDAWATEHGIVINQP
ncbi:MAG: NAD(+) diphosphatase [Thermomicrobiales bacterium]|nr:NAD(+) diphosphatase [Thermomicrobiales bacterium]